MKAGEVLITAASGGGWPPDFDAWEPLDWSALAGWVTALIALVAGIIALSQLRLARRLRREQSQPYVVAFMEPSVASPHLVDLVVRNFGTTVAKDVCMRIAPAPQRSVQGGEPEDVWMPESVPVLVPGQEWRTLWDFSPERAGTNLPDRHEALISYEDSQGRKLPATPSVLDWGAYKGRMWVTTYGIHDMAKALRSIDATTKKWKESIHGGLAVYLRDADAKDGRNREAFEAFKAARPTGAQEPDVSEGGGGRT